MTLRDLFALTRRRIGAIVLGVVIGIVGAAVAVAVIPVSYRASATAYVRVDVTSASSDAVGDYNQASQLASQKVKAFVPVFTSQAVAQGVINKLGLDLTPAQLASKISASNEQNSLTINVTASGPTAQEAQNIADETVRQAAEQVRELEGKSSPVDVVLMSSSALSTPIKSPSITKFGVLGVAGGLVLGYCLAFLRELLDRKVRTPDDAAEAVGAACLGTLPDSKAIDRPNPSGDNAWQIEESLRKIRTNLRYARVDKDLRRILVTSAVQGEGKSTVAKNLARVSAMAGNKVLLIEADLRRPVFRERFSIPSGRAGLAQLLVGAVNLESVIWKTDVEGLSVIPAGDCPPNPSELLASERMQELITYLAQDYVVILDAPPVLPVADALGLAGTVDGTVVVCSAGKTTTDQLVMVHEGLERAGTAILGVVINRVRYRGTDRLRYGVSEYAYAAHGYGHEQTNTGRGRRGKQPNQSRVSIAGAAQPQPVSFPPLTQPSGRPAAHAASTGYHGSTKPVPAGDQARGVASAPTESTADFVRRLSEKSADTSWDSKPTWSR